MRETPATTEAEEVRDPDAPPAARSRVRDWSAAGGWGFALGVGYAVLVRFYHAAGGQIGVAGEVSEQYVATLQMVSYLTGLVILVGAGACLVLTHRQFRVFPAGFRGSAEPRRPTDWSGRWCWPPRSSAERTRSATG